MKGSREEIDPLETLPLVDQNIALCLSRRDNPLPFTHIDLEHPFFIDE
jgi:hypothetical protein